MGKAQMVEVGRIELPSRHRPLQFSQVALHTTMFGFNAATTSA